MRRVGLRPQARRLERPRVDRLLPLPALQHRRAGLGFDDPRHLWPAVRPHRAVPPLQSSLESRLRALTASSSGSTLFQTGPGRRRLRRWGGQSVRWWRRCPAHPGSGSTSWPSPTASLADRGVRTERRADRSQAREESRPGGGGASGIVEHADAEQSRRRRGELSGAQGSGLSSGEKLGVSLTALNMQDADWWRLA